MGNSMWKCENCKAQNYRSAQVCSHCDKERNGLSLKSSKIMSYLHFHAKGDQDARQQNMNYFENSFDHFVDREFPPENQSLFSNGNKVMRKTLIHSSGFKQVKKWLRPHQINCGYDDHHYPITLINNPTPKDVIQGELGTCWFLSALALIAEKPLLIFNLLLTKQYNPYGMHQVRLCRRGEWKTITIDDYLPCDKSNQLVFSYGRKRQFWVPILEKALAKMYGSYENIAKGACAEGLQTLTGEPCEVIYLRLASSKFTMTTIHNGNSPNEDKNVIWNKVIQAKRNGYIMTTLCYNEGLSDSVFDKFGLLSRHIYSILDVQEFYDYNSKYRLIRLRNPWGHREWKGPWSDNWPHWPQHIKAQVSVYAKDDGCFWISFDDVLKYFYDITICKVRAEWSESRQSSFFYDYSNGIEAYNITIDQYGVYDFEIELFSTGYHREGFDRNADPTVDLCLILCKVDSQTNEVTCIAFEHSVEYYINVSAKLGPGNYIVFPTSIKAVSPMNRTHDYSSYNIVFHGQCNFTINKTKLPNEAVADLFYSVAKKQNHYKQELNGLVRSYVIHGSCTHAVLIENLSNEYWIRASLDTSSSTNLESTRLTKETSNCIRPRCREILAFLTPMNYRSGYVIGYKLDIKLCHFMTEFTFPPVSSNYLGLHASRFF